jgi:hypothetical protein
MTNIVLNIIYESWHVLLESAPFMIFGFFVAGLLKAFVKPDFVSKNLGSGKTSDIVKASLLGIPIPLCSCGVIPAAAQIKEQGAGKGATASFLISTPETGVDSIAVTWALLDPVMTVLRPLTAFISAIAAGIAVNFFDKKDTQKTVAMQEIKLGPVADLDEGNCNSGDCGCSGCGCGHDEHGHSHGESPKGVIPKIKYGLEYAFGELLQDIGTWFIAGVILAGIFSALIPEGFIENNLGDGFLSLLIMLVAAVPLYVCATASTPIAAALALKGLSPGAALVFLLAGPATNAASFTVVTKMLGRKSAFIYLCSIIVSALILGMLTNWLYSLLGLDISSWVNPAEIETHGILSVLSAVVLLAMILYPKVKHLIFK